MPSRRVPSQTGNGPTLSWSILRGAFVLAWMYDVSCVSGHRTRDIRRIQHSLVVQRQLPKVAEVLNVQVGRHGADEYGLLLEGIREGVRNTNRHNDDRARFNIDVVITTGEPHFAGGDDKTSSCS
jgi:hypothetical protein